MNRLFLGKVVHHPALGIGALSFEEQDVANTARVLQATFQAQTLQGNVYALRDMGVRLHPGEGLTLPEYQERLAGHHGAKGMAMDEDEVRRVLSEGERLAA